MILSFRDIHLHPPRYTPLLGLVLYVILVQVTPPDEIGPYTRNRAILTTKTTYPSGGGVLKVLFLFHRLHYRTFPNAGCWDFYPIT